MKQILIVGLFPMFLACGGSDDDSANPLIGTWGVELNESCALGAAFQETEFETDLVCILEDGSIGIEVYVADYTYTDSTITYTDRLGSCDVAPEVNTEMNYSFVGGNLRLAHPSGVFVLEPLDTDMASGIVAAYGCFEGGTFTPREIQEL